MSVKHKLEKALIAAKIIEGDDNIEKCNYTSAIYQSISLDKLICFECKKIFEDPAKYIELEYGAFPDEHILYFMIDEIRLLMSYDDDTKKWTATRVFLMAFEGLEKIVQAHDLEYLFKYPNPEYDSLITLEGIRPTKDIFVFHVIPEKIKKLEEHEYAYY